MMFLPIYFILNLLSIVFLTNVENVKYPTLVKIHLSQLWQCKDKKQLVQSLLYFFKAQSKYLTGPVCMMQILYTLFLHARKSDSEIHFYFDPGIVAKYAVQNGRNTLLQWYLWFGFNPGFRDSQGTTLLEYAFLYNNQQAGADLLISPTVFERSVTHSRGSNVGNVVLFCFTACTPLPFFSALFEKIILIKSLDVIVHNADCDTDDNNISNFIKEIRERGHYVGGKYLIDACYYDPFYPGSEREIHIYKKRLYRFEFKLFEKICLRNGFTEQDVDFLKNEGLVFSKNNSDLTLDQDIANVLNRELSGLLCLNAIE